MHVGTFYSSNLIKLDTTRYFLDRKSLLLCVSLSKMVEVQTKPPNRAKHGEEQSEDRDDQKKKSFLNQE
jgi:hypothetical protein